MKERNFQQIKEELPGIKRNVSLKSYTTFKIGGPAKYFFEAKGKEDLIEAILVAKSKKLPFFILGGGSNLLVADEGFNGLVIKMQNAKCKTKNENSKCKISCEAGTPLALLVSEAAKNNLTGLEWAAGIPGTVGGAINGNAGAFKKSMKNIVREVEVFDAKELGIKNYKLRDCQFGYRNSLFKKNPHLIILSVTLQLKKGNKLEIEKRIKEYLNYRKEKQPLNLPSVGSIFKNSKNFSAGELGEEDKSSSLSTELPKEAKVRKRTKFSCDFAAARLIEECGLKGKRIGNVKISEKHANFIVNLGGGKAEDVKKLINLVKKKVKNRFKINLEEEICYLGFKN